MDNGSNPITREILIDHIDAEYEKVNQDLSEDTKHDRLEVMPYLRDALYALPIPDELMVTAYSREYVLDEVYMFWTNHKSKDDDVADKIGYACESAGRWLADVRYEYRFNLLGDHIATELADFLEEERQKTPDEIIEDAWKITCFQDIQIAIENEELSIRDVDALLTLEQPLQSIYDEYLSKDMSEHMQSLINTTEEIAQLQHKNIIGGYIHESKPNIRDIEAYLSRYDDISINDGQAECDLEQ